jgi:ParB-like chromosome segregation protein Spo0J
MTSPRRLVLDHVDPTTLVPAPYNPRTMTSDARARLQRGIEAFGFLDPIIARRFDRLIIGGHQRHAIAVEEGYAEVPVIWAEDLSDEECAALNVLLNNPEAQGEWDLAKLTAILSPLDAAGFDATLTGFDEGQLERMLTWTPSPAPGAALPGAEAIAAGHLGAVFDRLQIPVTPEEEERLTKLYLEYKSHHVPTAEGFVSWLLTCVATHRFFG